MRLQEIQDYRLDELIAENISPTYFWDPNRIIIDGVMFYRSSRMSDISNKSSANSLIQKEPYFSYSFVEEVYNILEKYDDIYAITYARPKSLGAFTHVHKYEIDLLSAYPHILKYERLPIDGVLYTTPQKSKMNFYKYTGDIVKTGCLITDDLAEYLGYKDCAFVFATDYTLGSKMGDKLHAMAHKHKESKKEIKGVHYGLWQRRYIDYDAKQDCYVRNPANNHELLMVAILSQLSLIMLQIRDVIGDSNGVVVTDAYKWDSDFDMHKLNAFMARQWGNYNYRIKKLYEGVIYQTYKNLPCKRCYVQKSTKAKQKVCACCTLRKDCGYVIISV